MKTTIIGYALAAAGLAFAFVDTAQAANAYWNGNGADNKWSTKENWYGNTMPPEGTSGKILFKTTTANCFVGSYTALLDSAVGIDRSLWVENGSSPQQPYVFETSDSAHGLTLTGDGQKDSGYRGNAYVGYSTNGYLHIKSGTYSFRALYLGNSSETDRVGWLKVGDGSSSVSLAVNGANSSFRGKSEFVADNATLDFSGKNFNMYETSRAYISNSVMTAASFNVAASAINDCSVVFYGGSVTVSNNTVLAYGDGSTGTLTVRNGTFATKSISARGTGILNIDGATLRAVTNSVNFIDGGVIANVGDLGATIDNGGMSISVASTFNGTGDMTLTGAGTTIFSANQAYTGTTTVKVGSVFMSPPAGVSFAGAFAVETGGEVALAGLSERAAAITASSFSFANGVKVSVHAALARGRYKLFTLSSGTFAADAADALQFDCAYPFTVEVNGDTIYFAIDQGYAPVDNNLTSLTVTGKTELVGAGGVKLAELSIPAGATLVLDPISTPVYVAGQPSISGKIALSSEYAGMTCGEVVLLSFDGNDFDPRAVFDSSSVAGEVTYLGFREAPDGKNQFVLTVGDYAHAPEIRILAIGDSITHGYVKNIPSSGVSQQAQYRTLIAARLAANGYKPVMLGHLSRDASNTETTCDAAGVQQPDEWIWHSGVSGDKIISDSDGGKRGGVRDNLHVYLDVAGEPDVVTLLIGTNDILARSAETVFEAYTNLVWDLKRQRPRTKIVASTILERANATANAKIRTFNQSLLSALDTPGALPDTFACTNLYPVAPQSVADNYFDGTHPTMKGFDPIAKGFAAKIMETLPLVGENAFTGPIDDMLDDAPQVAQGATNNVPAAYRDGMVHVFSIDATKANNNFSTASPYTETVSPMPLTQRIKKAGYYLELVRRGTSRRRFVWVDFDATGKTLDEIDFPWTGDNIDLVVEKLHVYSNDGSIHNVAADDNTVRGAIEGTHHNFGGADDDSSISADIYPGFFGWNDKLGSDGGYGCFQAHRIFSQTGDDTHWNGGEVLFAWNAWGSGNTKVNDEIGIGTFFFSQAFNNSSGTYYGATDYTHMSKATKGAEETINSGAYQVRHLEIWVERPNTMLIVK